MNDSYNEVQNEFEWNCCGVGFQLKAVSTGVSGVTLGIWTSMEV